MTLDKVKTRLLIISDTHGVQPQRSQSSGKDTDDELSQPDITRVATGFRDPLPEADVVLHCGDLTKRGQPVELQETFSMLRQCRAPLKLVIAGNHDLSLDPEFWASSMSARFWGENIPKESWQIIKDAEADGVRYLDEGVYTFDLDNCARLKIFASQWTPTYGSWAFQYSSYESHNFDIPAGVDVAMTHGPPQGVLDFSGMGGVHAGCESLIRSVRQSRPKVHCFGHIHEAWGAYLAQWKNEGEGSAAIDKESSRQIVKAAGLKPLPMDGWETARRKVARLKDISKQRGYHVDLTAGSNRLEEDKQTLFVNAAIMDIKYRPVQCPWIVDIDLPKAQA